jgi:hypothetical protein
MLEKINPKKKVDRDKPLHSGFLSNNFFLEWIYQNRKNSYENRTQLL